VRGCAWVCVGVRVCVCMCVCVRLRVPIILSYSLAPRYCILLISYGPLRPTVLARHGSPYTPSTPYQIIILAHFRRTIRAKTPTAERIIRNNIIKIYARVYNIIYAWYAYFTIYNRIDPPVVWSKNCSNKNIKNVTW